jgi:hypothetical protein
MASTKTYTATVTRMGAIVMEIRMALRRTTDISNQWLSAIVKGVKNQWIEKISIYALDDQKLCLGELIVSIDWNLYDSLMSTGKVTIALDPKHFGKYENQPVSIELDEAVILFREFITDHNLKTIYQVSYPSNFNSEKIKEVRKELGFVPAEKVKWSEGQSTSKKLGVEKLPELHIGLHLLES